MGVAAATAVHVAELLNEVKKKRFLVRVTTSPCGVLLWQDFPLKQEMTRSAK